MAQWTVVSLQPAGASYSHAYGVHGGQQVGAAQFAGSFRAALWSGTAASWVDLDATGGSYAYGVGDGQQVGVWTYFDGIADTYLASLWSGSAASWVDLSSGFPSEAFGASGGQQVGVLHDEFISHASLWTGSAASWVSLNPPGADWATAYGVSGGQQVGFARDVSGSNHASLWSGTAASWVDLHPAGAAHSEAFGVQGSQQAGWALIGSWYHASLWSGTAGSWVDLHKSTWTSSSRANAVHGGKQVGYAYVDGVQRASIWSGTAASWVDLNAFLPRGSSSIARGIWSDANFLYVVGTSSIGAVMWVRPLVDPPAAPGTPSLAKLTGGQVRITWADNSANEEGFRVQREKKSGSQWIGTQIVATVGANVATATNSPGTGTFRYRVQSFLGASDSVWSGWAQIKN